MDNKNFQLIMSVRLIAKAIILKEKYGSLDNETLEALEEIKKFDLKKGGGGIK